MASYCYKLREKSTGKLYVGCQYSPSADPKNLLVKYKTSCRYIHERGVEAFEIVKIVIRDDAREFERRYLRRMYTRLGYDAFQLVFINRNLAPGIIFTADVRERMSISLKLAAARRREAGTLLPTFQGRAHTQKTKDVISKKAIQRLQDNGHPQGMLGKSHTEPTKERIRNTCTANSAMRGRVGDAHPTGGTVWWNDGKTHKRSADRPGEAWIMGRLFKPRTRKGKDCEEDRNKINPSGIQTSQESCE